MNRIPGCIDKAETIKDSRSILLSVSLYSLSFLIPFLFPGPQIITGTIINALLFFTALRFTGKQIIPLLFLPGVATLSRGLLFGPATPFLVYFLPVIWLGNYLLIFSSKAIFEKTGSPVWMVLISAGIKYSLLAVFARIYFSFGLVPLLFLTAMGVIQFATAIFGGAITFATLSKFNRNN